MTKTGLLKEEMNNKPAGNFAPKHFRALGFRAGKEGDIPAKRAAVCHALFTETDPWIYQNDLIVGSMRPLWYSYRDGEEKKRDEAISDLYGERSFITNSDHFAPDYAYVVNRGIPGILEDIVKSQKVHKDEPERLSCLANMKYAAESFLDMIRAYEVKARSLMGTEGYSDENLSFIIRNLSALQTGAPRTFAQGLQLVWLCHTAFLYEQRYAQALGRMDQYLYPLFRKDTEAGELDEAGATEYLENVFMKIFERRAYMGADDVVNICIGGKNMQGGSDVNRLSYCILHGVKNCNVPGPNLSARIADNTADDFLDECLQVIGTGLGYPALMNDEVNIPALSRYTYDPEDVYNYCMVGCIENFLPGKQPPWSDGRFDTPRFFEYLFNNGKAIRYGSDGIDTGDVDSIDTMDELMRRFEAQLSAGVRQYVENTLRNSRLANESDYTSPFLSLFARDCILRGRDINLGGAKYPSVHGAALMGIGTVCDSLAAIEKTVFIDKTATLARIGDAMRVNFEGMESLRHLLLSAPKYGNNDPLADKYAVWFVDFLYREFAKYRTKDNGWFYIIMAANTSNIPAGRRISATPDGRGAGEPLSDAASPTYGRDRSGATATVLSCAKPDYTKVSCGTVLNQKFSPAMFEDGKRKNLLNLIRVYFKLGGQEMQINATSREVLQDAMDHPEMYRNLVVRVSGFSALYVTLDAAIQHDILMRTQQSI